MILIDAGNAAASRMLIAAEYACRLAKDHDVALSSILCPGKTRNSSTDFKTSHQLDSWDIPADDGTGTL